MNFKQYLYIKVHILSGRGQDIKHVYQVDWPDNRSDQYKPMDQQSCKYTGRLAYEKGLKVRLEVCRFLVSLSLFLTFRSNLYCSIYEDSLCSKYKTVKVNDFFVSLNLNKLQMLRLCMYTLRFNFFWLHNRKKLKCLI